jgi:hypothetical protein
MTMGWIAFGLRRLAKRWPALRRRRGLWFRPAFELLTLAVLVLSMAWMVQSDLSSPSD